MSVRATNALELSPLVLGWSVEVLEGTAASGTECEGAAAWLEFGGGSLQFLSSEWSRGTPNAGGGRANP